MDPITRLKILRASAQEKADYIDSQLSSLETLLDKLGILLNERIVTEYLSQLNTESGMVLSDLQNQRKAALIDRAYDTFMQQSGHKVVVKMIDDLYGVTGLNADYFSKMEGMKINTTDIDKIINQRLGLNDEGELKRNGFMKGVLDNPTVKDQIKNFALDKTIGGTGYEDLRSGLKTMIEGDSEKMGNFKQWHRNLAYDTYARIDAMNGKLYADSLNLKFFIYAGTRRKASRYFCIHRKGQCFADWEAESWKDLIGTTTTDENGKRVQAGPIVTGPDVETYNWAVDRGGYGCVDDIMWVTDEVAFSMRPDLRDGKPKTKPQKKEKSKDAEKADKKKVEKKSNDSKTDIQQSESKPNPRENQKKPGLLEELRILTEELRTKVRDTLKKEITPTRYRDIKKYENGGLSAVHKDADPKDLHGSQITADMIAKKFGSVVTVREHINQAGIKNPELSIDGTIADNKTPNHSGPDAYKTIANPFKRRTQEAIDQGAEAVSFVLEKRYTLPDVIEGVRRAFHYKSKSGKQIGSIYVRYREDGITKVTREQFESGDFVKHLEDEFIPEKK